ncbi:MAG: hypothetical protein FWG70_11135 [Oscillospiraceae bacterium]|nr:hypothetical protein [Oscillospiraceae bacterium]
MARCDGALRKTYAPYMIAVRICGTNLRDAVGGVPYSNIEKPSAFFEPQTAFLI